MKMAKRIACRIGLLALLFFLKTGSAAAQDAIADALVRDFKDYQVQTLQEKLFAHVDRNFYSAGEIIWFKLYDVDAHFNRPLDLSKLAYVEILSKDLKPVLQAKIVLKNGYGNGSFLIPFSIGSGNYVFRAYTSWMKNFSPDFYFEKPITIVNSLRQPLWDQNKTKKYDIQFFPEGGNMVEGIQSKIGFRVVDQYGQGQDCAGAIVNQNKDTVARFRSLKFGLGHFLFTPLRGQTYSAAITIGAEAPVLQSLPAVHTEGYVMSVTEPDKEHLLVTVSSNSVSGAQVYLFVQTRQLFKTAMVAVLANGKAIFNLDKKSLGEGISQLIIFNASRQPVCERLFFKRPAARMELDVKTDKPEYGLREKVSLALNTNLTGQAAEGAEMSVAVFMKDSLQSGNPTSLFDYLWLTSDLKGTIESPEYYLNNSGPDVDEAIENLMLTHGWSRFKWDDVLQHRKLSFEFLPEYDGHIVNGKVIDKRTGQPVPNITTYLSVPGEKFRLKISTSNKKGEVRYDIKDFYASGEIVLQTSTKSDSLYRVDVANPFSEKFSNNPLLPFGISEKWENQLLFRSRHAQVEDNFLQDKKQRFLAADEMDSLAFYGKPDKRYFLDDYTRFITMEEVMREYIAEVRVRKQRDHFHFTVSDPAHGYFFENEPMVLLDGIPVFDMDKIIAFDPLKIKKIEIVSRRYFLDSLVNEGIVSYSTYHGNLAGFQLDPNALIVEYPGMQLEREFFSPVYDTKASAESRIPDFRNLLYWSPSVRVDETGKSLLPFYTSDIPGNYIIVVQGLNQSGLAGTGISGFNVKK